MPAQKGSGELPIPFLSGESTECRLLISVKMVHRGNECAIHVIESRDKPIAYGWRAIDNPTRKGRFA